MVLPSSALGSKPRYQVSAEYTSPRESGLRTCASRASRDPVPACRVVDRKSPPRSRVSTAARSNGLGKKALAAWASWWPTCSILPRYRQRARKAASLRNRLASTKAWTASRLGARRPSASATPRARSSPGRWAKATTSTWSIPMPAMPRQNPMVWSGKRLVCRWRLNRSSSANATSRPSSSRQAAVSWLKQLIPRTRTRPLLPLATPPRGPSRPPGPAEGFTRNATANRWYRHTITTAAARHASCRHPGSCVLAAPCLGLSPGSVRVRTGHAGCSAVVAVVASVAVAPGWLIDGAGLGVDRTRLLAVPALAEDSPQHRPDEHGEQRAQADDGADLGPFVTRGRDADAAQVPERGGPGAGVDLVSLRAQDGGQDGRDQDGQLPNVVTAPARMASNDSLPIPASRASLARSLLDPPVMVSAMRILSVREPRASEGSRHVRREGGSLPADWIRRGRRGRCGR